MWEEPEYQPESYEVEIQNIINKVVESKIQDKLDLLDQHQRKITELNAANLDLKKELNLKNKELSSAINRNEFFDVINTQITKDNVTDILGILFKKDFNEKSGINDVPMWFNIIVNYYSNKTLILFILRYIGIEIPSWVNDFRLPLDWNKEELDLFFKTLPNHYVCNGCIYDGNLGFWYREHSNLTDINKMLKHNYSEVPWQFVLRNKLLNTKEYCLKMAQEINNRSNGWYFSEVTKYQKLDEECLSELINNVKFNFKKFGDVPSFITENITLIQDKEKLDRVYKLFTENSYESQYNIDKYLDQFPTEYTIKFITEKHTCSEKVLKSTNRITKEEKINLLSLFVN